MLNCVLRSRFTTIASVIAALVLACARPEQPQESRAATYVLASIGGRPLPYVPDSSADGRCVGGLRASHYALAARQWTSVDTLFERCAVRAEPDSTWTRKDSGTFALRGDTIQFENPTAGPGEARVVLLGLLRGDTLTAWGSDLDGGEYVYVRELRR